MMKTFGKLAKMALIIGLVTAFGALFFGTAGEVRNGRREEYERGVELYDAGKYAEAAMIFYYLQDWSGGDGPSPEDYYADAVTRAASDGVMICPHCGYPVTIGGDEDGESS